MLQVLQCEPKRFPFGLNASGLCHVWKWKNPLYNYHSDVWSQKMREKRTICRQKLQKCAINHWGCKENKMNWSDGFVLAEPSHNKRFYCCDHIVNKEMHGLLKAIPIWNNEVNRRWGLWGKIHRVTKTNWNLDVVKRNSWLRHNRMVWCKLWLQTWQGPPESTYLINCVSLSFHHLHLYLYLYLQRKSEMGVKDYRQPSILSWRTTIGGHQTTSHVALGVIHDDCDHDD